MTNDAITVNETTRGATPRHTVVNPLPQGIVDAIVASHISHTVSSVKVGAKSSPTKKEESASYDQLVAHNAQGMAALCGGKLDTATPAPEEGDDTRSKDDKRLGAADHFNYGYDLARRAKCRSTLVTRLEGPDKAIAKAVRSLIDADMFDNEDDAREHVLARRKARSEARAKTAEGSDGDTDEADDGDE